LAWTDVDQTDEKYGIAVKNAIKVFFAKKLYNDCKV
jgi:hypothetical protein